MEGASVTVNESKGLKKGARVRLIHSDELIAAFSEQTRRMRNPLALWVNVMHNGNAHDISLIPDLVLGLKFPDGSRRCFMVEIDRGTMLSHALTFARRASNERCTRTSPRTRAGNMSGSSGGRIFAYLP
jgi:hypothetical protein